MNIKNIDMVYDFLKAADKCKGEVYMTSIYGDKYNLKSKLSQFVAVAALLSEHGDELELWCSNHADEEYFREYFQKYPDVLGGI